MRVVAFAGGTGSAKLVGGLARLVRDLVVVANVGDNFWFHGLYVCPDVDIALYTLAGMAEPRHGWGVRGDSFNVLGQLSKLGEETWFRMGDLDLATAIVRTKMLGSGKSLTEATSKIRKALGVRVPVLPATDCPVETMMVTGSGSMHLQEYWVKRRGVPRVKRVEYAGANRAFPTRQVKQALASADRIIICPANPITSIGPIVAVSGMKRLLSSCGARVVALSPMVGRRPYSGPAGRLMSQLGIRPDSVGIALLYAGFVDELVIDERDADMKEEIERRGVSCSFADTRMRTSSQQKRLASVLLRE